MLAKADIIILGLQPFAESPDLAGCGKTRWARRNFIGLYIWDNRSTPRRMLKKARRLTRPAPARRDAPFRGQGRSSAADSRFTFHASRFTAAGSAARTPLADFFSILLEKTERHSPCREEDRRRSSRYS